MTTRTILLFGALVLAVPMLKAQSLGPIKVTTYDHDMAKVVLPPDLTEIELKGRHLFVLRCAACHTQAANSYGPRLNRDRITTLGDDPVRAKINTGGPRMPGFRYMLSPADLDLLMAYLKTIPPAKTPGNAPSGESNAPTGRSIE